MFTVHMDLTAAVHRRLLHRQRHSPDHEHPAGEDMGQDRALPYKWLAPMILFLCMMGTIVIRYSCLTCGSCSFSVR
jgi:hypothetical protein